MKKALKAACLLTLGVLFMTTLTGCDELGLTTETRAPRMVLDQVRLPPAYVFARNGLGDNGSANPVQIYTAPPGPSLRASQVQLPAGYERRPDLEHKLEDGPAFSGPWNLVGYWEGPSPLGKGTCNVFISSNSDSM